jgi:hypothetical protein
MRTEELLGQLQAFALSTKSPRIVMSQFLRTLPPDRLDTKEIESGVKELAFKGAFALEAEDGRLLSISFPDFPVLALIDEYHRVAQDPSRAFPREDTAPVPIPPADITPLDVKSQLGELLDEKRTGAPVVAKVIFPEGIPALIVPRASARTDFVDAAVARISRYLQDIKNSAYAESKLSTLLKGSEVPARQALEDLALRPRKAVATILLPTEFSFRFWNHLANVLIQDRGRKAELSEADTSVLQSAYVVIYTVFYQKGAAQREQERAADRKALEQQIRRAPFVFTHQDLYLLRDEKGVTYSSKHTREFIDEFLKESLQKTEEDNLPMVLRLHHASTSRDYFVQRDMVVPVFLKKLTDASDALRISYVKDWVDQLRQDQDPPITQSDAVFRKDLDTRVRDEFTLLAVLANGPILRALLETTSMDEDTQQELSRCFNTQGSLRPMTGLLGISRTRLLREARSYLPFWQTMPVIRGLARFLRRLLRRREAEESGPPLYSRSGNSALAYSPGKIAVGAPQGAGSGSAPAADATGARAVVDKQVIQRYQKTIRDLMAVYVPAGKKTESVLADLIDKWNPLLEPGPKEDLVHDVNALVQDFVRPIRRNFILKPPDLKRVKSLAEQLSASKSLGKIRKREPLMRYLELYVLQTLLG